MSDALALETRIDTANELRLYLAGFDDGAATAWRTMADLVRAGCPAERLTAVILHMSGTVPHVSS